MNLHAMSGRLAACLFFALLVSRAAAGPESEWPAFGRDAGGMRHSPLNQINRENVGKLKVAWTYRTGEQELLQPTKAFKSAAFEATPIMIEGVLYFSTPSGRVFALDAATGVEKWKYDPKTNLNAGFSEVTSRGVSTWVDPTKKPGDPGRRRIYIGTITARLIALDAATGAPCADFGKLGTIDLREGIKSASEGMYQVTSPPAVIGDLIVAGSSMGDNRRLDSESGVVRAFDARTGAERWSWDPIPRNTDDPRAATWKGEKALQTGAANAWSVIAADPERDLVFVPTSCPSPDFYGGERKGTDFYSSSLVALRASTGKLVWAFQAVHHDIWDYDLAPPPALITIKRDGKEIPAVVQGTKMGHIFILNRETGDPLFPVEERATPKSNVEGEEAWPTQPFPTAPPLLGLRKLSAEDAWGATPEDQKWAADRLKGMRLEGTFTPPSLEGTAITPSNIGGVHWGGLSFDPDRGLIFVNTNRIATLVRLIPRKNWIKEWQGNMRAEISPMAGTPFGMARETFRTPSGLPGTPPPWGVMTAIDAAKGEVKWEVPLGSMADPAKYPDAEKWGSINMGGCMTTAGGLVFVAATFDNHLRAFDAETGKVLWKELLPASAQAMPMTYADISGRQYLVICAGGHGKMGTRRGDYVVAYSLSE